MAAILIISGSLALISCSSEDDPVVLPEKAYTGVPLVILDTDLGSSTDDLFALEMLHRYEQEGRWPSSRPWRATTSSRSPLAAASP